MVAYIFSQCTFHVQVEAVGNPPYPGPNDFLILSLVTMIMCGVLNITSLMIGIPGLVFAGLVSVLIYCMTDVSCRETDTQHCYCQILSYCMYVIMLSCLMHETCLLFITLFCTCEL